MGFQAEAQAISPLSSPEIFLILPLIEPINDFVYVFNITSLNCEDLGSIIMEDGLPLSSYDKIICGSKKI